MELGVQDSELVENKVLAQGGIMVGLPPHGWGEGDEGSLKLHLDKDFPHVLLHDRYSICADETFPSPLITTEYGTEGWPRGTTLLGTSPLHDAKLRWDKGP